MRLRWWHVGLVVALVALVVGVGVVRLTAKPAAMGLAKVERRQVAFFESLMPEGEAATTRLLEAWEEMDAISARWPGEAQGRWDNLIWALLDDREMLPEQRSGAVALFETLGPGIDIVIEASFASRLVEDVQIDPNGSAAIWRNPRNMLGGDSLRLAYRVLMVEKGITLEHDDSVRAVECIRSALRFSRLYRQAPDMLGVLIGYSVVEGARAEAIHAAQRGLFSSDACRAIAGLLLEDSLWRWMLSADVAEAMRLREHWEEASRRDELRQTPALALADLRLRGGLGLELDSEEKTDLAWLDWTCARSPDDAARLIDEYGARLAEWYVQPFETRAAPAPTIAGHPFASTLHEVPEQVRGLADVLQSKLAGAALALRLIALRQDGGELPESLSELDWPEAVCPLTGQLFEYERRSPDAGDPRAFVIRIPVTQAELSRVAPRMGRNLEHWVLVTPEPRRVLPVDKRRGSYERLLEGEKLEAG